MLVSRRHGTTEQCDTDTGAGSAPDGAPQRDVPCSARGGHDEVDLEARHDGTCAAVCIVSSPDTLLITCP